MMSEQDGFHIEVKVRHYELDTLGHLNHAVYHSYAEIARLELMEQAGPDANLREQSIAPVLLDSHISFRREIRSGETVRVGADTKFGSGKTFRMDSVITKPDGSLAAEITCTLGLMHLEQRRLVDDPQGRFAAAGFDTDALRGTV